MMRVFRTALVGGAIVAAVTLSLSIHTSVHAQQLTFSYSVKYVCGTVPFVGLPQSLNTVVMPGDYATTINVHNPHMARRVIIAKKGLSLRPGQKPTAPGKFRRETLTPDWGFEMSCQDIIILGGGTPLIPLVPAREGFVVIYSSHEIDVVAVYTYKNIEWGPRRGIPSAGVGVGSSIDVEYIQAKRI